MLAEDDSKFAFGCALDRNKQINLLVKKVNCRIKRILETVILMLYQRLKNNLISYQVYNISK